MEEDGTETGMSDPETMKKHCAELFALRDYVMEPDVVATLLAYFQAGGEPALVVDSLSSTYEGLSQFSNLLGCWMAELEAPSAEATMDSFHASGASMPAERELVESKLESCALVRNVFESTVSKLVGKVFSPTSADKIFDVVEGSEGGLDWLPMLIAHRPWRSLIYQLVEAYPNCLMLNFAVKLISDAGFQHEISNVSTAAQQLDIFSRVFLSSVEQLLVESRSGENTTPYRKAFEELRKIACFSEQTNLYIQALFKAAAERSTSGAGKAAVANIAQSLRVALVKQGREAEVAPISAALLQSDSDQIPSNVTQAMLTMLVKGTLNPADMGQLYQAYFEPFPPPVELIRDPYFVSLLVDALFSNLTARINTEHRPKYIFLMAYATSVGETLRNGGTASRSKASFSGGGRGIGVNLREQPPHRFTTLRRQKSVIPVMVPCPNKTQTSQTKIYSTRSKPQTADHHWRRLLLAPVGVPPPSFVSGRARFRDSAVEVLLCCSSLSIA